MKKTLIIIAAIVVILALYAWSSYNGLVTLREGVTAQWQQVETVYQRRFDLIPGLVNATKAVLVQEQKVFADIADARSRYSGAQSVSDKATAATQVESALSRLLVVMENYPVLKSSDTVRDLMTQLEGSENRIAVERSRFNETVKSFNTVIKKFPKNLLASMFGFDVVEYFEAQTGAENAVKVELI
ncbi:MAG: LemA family protein [Candidatus Pacebacteria bacterium]|nr:LemA family protein [Candidatus Paceibacterota bacterium]